ncbi:hypothetical protein RI129_000165 [Pyrocoelia pectoralis]|uniref:CCHC-type domain-containing protein n=1 Tax=Pyrocoelia pectoralis TaxID=417401 RepID=A0AAN7V1Y8_9COLE
MTTYKKYESIIEENDDTEKEGKVRFLFLAHADGTTQEQRAKSSYETLQKAATRMMATKQNRAKIFAEREMARMVAKLAECAFYNKGIAYCVDGNTKKQQDPNKGTNSDSVTILLKDQNMTYADLLKGARKALTGPEREALKASHKTKDGNLRLVIDQRKGDVNAVTSKLREELGQSAECKVRQDRDTYYIRELDEITTKDDVTKAITASMGDTPAGWLEVSEIRTSESGRRTATLVVAKEKSQVMDEHPAIWVGITKCPIRKRVEVQKCAKCWGVHEKAGKCADRDVKGKCLNCGSEGHFRDNCKNDKHCALCNQPGHAPWTMACPEYKAAIRAAERGRTKSRLVNRKIDTPSESPRGPKPPVI